MVLFATLLMIILIHLYSFQASPTVRYSAGCFVPLCSIGNCSSRPLCYEFQTTTNQPLCAPPVICTLFDPCINGTTACASNTSVCIANSCCAGPICMPLALNFTCAISETTDTNTSITITPTVVTTPATTLDLSCTWSSWVNGRCSVTCGTGTYVRQRYCLDQFNNNCGICAANTDINGTRPCFYPSCTP